MTVLTRLREWWIGQFQGSGRLGKAAWIVVPALFACCGLTMCSTLLSPDAAEPEPTAVVAERAGATVEVAATQAVVEAAVAPSRTVSPTATGEVETETRRPTLTPAPTATSLPATATIAPSATAMSPTVTRPPATATAAPPTATQPAATATSVPPTATRPPATAAPLPTVTAVPPTALPQPTATQPPAATSGDVVISSIRYDGDVPQVESDEYAVITNRGATAVNLANWRLNAGEPDQNFVFPAFDLQPGQSCRVYTDESHPESCGFSFGRGDAIWRNSNDCGYLYNAEGAEVSRFCWN